MEDENHEEEEEEVNSKRTSFLNQVDEILGECDPKSLQRGLFSATIGPLVQDLGFF
jgi:superfamily II DNA/RNA helicase